jgi:hypothetical protein
VLQVGKAICELEKQVGNAKLRVGNVSYNLELRFATWKFELRIGKLRVAFIY